MAVLDINKPQKGPTGGRVLDITPPSIKKASIGGPAAIPAVTADETDAVKNLPEIGFSGLLAGESPMQVSKAAAAILTSPNPREIANMLDNMFPDIGIQEDEQGNLIAGNNKTGVKVVINKPGASPIDIMQTIGIGTMFTPSAQLAAIPTNIAARATIAGTSAGLTQGIIEGLQQEAGGEFNEEEIAIATILGGASEVVLPTIQALRQSKLEKKAQQAGQALDDVKEQVQRADEAGKATGVDLFEAQKTTIPSDIERQAFVAQLPAGSVTARNALVRQNKQAALAVDDFLGQIAPEQNVSQGAENFRTAAQRAIQKRINIRKERTSKFYQAAFDDPAKVDVSQVNDLINGMLNEFPDGARTKNELLRVKKMISPKGGANLKMLHNAKLEIDDSLNSYGADSIGRTAKNKLTQIKEMLLQTMDDQSPAYKEARERFAEASPMVNKIQDSIVGKVADMDDTQLKNISRRLFDPSEAATTVGDIRRAKTVISNVDPDAWNDIVRVELERRLGAVRSTLEGGTVENIPDQLFRSIFGNQKQRRVLYAAVDGRIEENLKFLETALDRARLGRPGGSQTAIRSEIKKEFEGGPGSWIRQFFSGPLASVGSATGTVLTGATADAAVDAKVRAAAKVLFDPDWAPKLKRVQELSIDSPAFGRAMFQLLDDAVKTDLENLQDE